MIDFDFDNGMIYISDDLKICPGFTFEEFRRSGLYDRRSSVEHICIKGMPETQYVWLGEHLIGGVSYLVNLLFRGETIQIVSFVCCDRERDIGTGEERKAVHDLMLEKYDIFSEKSYDWGSVLSEHDPDTDFSSISITFFTG